MAVSRVLLVEPDPFSGTATRVAGYVPAHRDNEGVHPSDKDLTKMVGFNINDIQQVSRPLRGIVAKPNTHAFVQVIKANGDVVSVFNKLGDRTFDIAQKGNAPSTFNENTQKIYAAMEAGIPTEQLDLTEPKSKAWTDWILQSVSESRVEKTQVIETFGSTYLYAFGQKPRALVFNGLLLNTADYNWRAIFWENWDNFFRATRLVEQNARMYISWDDIVVEGYPLNAVANQVSDSPNALTFSFNFFVTRYINIDADSGFTRLRGDNISALTTGRDQGIAKLRHNNKLSALDLLGLTGATYTGGLVEKALLEGGGSFFGDPAVAALAGKNVAAAHRGLVTGVLAANRGSYNGAAFLRAFLRKTGFDFTRDLTNIAFRELEKSTGVSKAAINAYFGYLAMMLNDVDALKQSGGGRLLLHGSVDRIIQGMSYHLFDIGGQKPSTATTVNKAGVSDTGAGVFPQTTDSGLAIAGVGAGLLVLGTGAAFISAKTGEALGLERDQDFEEEQENRTGIEGIKI